MQEREHIKTIIVFLIAKCEVGFTHDTLWEYVSYATSVGHTQIWILGQMLDSW